MPVNGRLQEYLRGTGWKDPKSTTESPYAAIHQTGGKGFFDHLSNKPDRMLAFNQAMTVQTMTSMWLIDLFPWRQHLLKQDTTSDTVLVVDVGGGEGNALLRIQSLCEGIPGRLILQDRPVVMDNTELSLGRVEKMGHNFFKPQPVKGE